MAEKRAAELSDEELEKQLAGAVKEETTEKEEEKIEAEDKTNPEEPPVDKSSGNEDIDEVGKTDAPSNKAEDGIEKDRLLKQAIDKEEFLKRQEKELEDLNSMTLEQVRDLIRNRDKIIGTNARKIGDKRKEVAKQKLDELNKLENEDTDDFDSLYVEDPKKAVDSRIKKNIELERQKANAQAEYENALITEMLMETKDAILDVEPNFEKEYVNEIINLVKKDAVEGKVKGLNEDMIEGFKQNPYAAGHTWLTKMIIRVNKDKFERAKLSLETKKEQVLDKIEKVANNKPIITGSNKQSSVNNKKIVFDPKKADNYSDEELDALLKEYDKKGE